jgi:hypothetical protein
VIGMTRTATAGWRKRSPPACWADDQRRGDRKEQRIVTQTLTYQQMGTAASGQAQALFAQTMRYVAGTAARRSAALTVGLLAAFGLLIGLPGRKPGRVP